MRPGAAPRGWVECKEDLELLAARCRGTRPDVGDILRHEAEIPKLLLRCVLLDFAVSGECIKRAEPKMSLKLLP